MSRFPLSRLACCSIAVCVALAGAPVTAQSASPASLVGQVAFDYPHAPPPTVQVNLTEAIFHDLVGIGEAAIAGVVEVVAETLADNQAELAGLDLSPEEISAVQHVFTTVKGVVRGVQVHIYEGDAESSAKSPSMTEYYTQKLLETGWDQLVQVNEGNDQVRVSMFRESGAIRGLFVSVEDGDDKVLVNAAIDLSPDKVKELTSTSLRIAKDVGGEKAVAEILRKVAAELDLD